jgi:hypothetical protein
MKTFSWLCRVAAGGLAWAGTLAPAMAQVEPPPAAARPAASPRVVGAHSTDPAHRERIGLGYALFVEVEGLAAALDGSDAACDQLTLFLDDIPIDGSAPDSCDVEESHVRFTLARTPQSAAAWRLLFTEPWEFVNPVSVSVGPRGRLPWPTAVELDLVILPTFWVYAYFISLAVALALLVRLARRTALLRDRGEGAAAGASGPYSLARFQLAFWLFLVVAAYVFIWMITGELDTITGSVLALLGIGSGTALGAALIDQGKADAALAGSTADAAPPRPVASQGFVKDLLSDEKGISLYRFQLFVWTLVLGVIFCTSVYNTLSMPQFSPTLLGLMGISSGTYLGFKVPEPPSGRRE